MKTRLFFLGALAVGGWTGLAGCGSSVDTESTASGGSGGAGGVTSSSSTGGAGNAGGTGGVGNAGGTGGVGGSGGGIGGTGGAGGGPMCPGLGDVCTECLSVECAGTYCSCYGNLECGALVQCFNGCSVGDAACFQGCLTAHQDGISAAYLLSDCGASACDAACPNNQALPPCRKCLFTSCDVQMNACYANAECLALFVCAQACQPGDMACQQGCVSQHQGGAQDAQGVIACSKALCSNTCN